MYLDLHLGTYTEALQLARYVLLHREIIIFLMPIISALSICLTNTSFFATKVPFEVVGLVVGCCFLGYPHQMESRRLVGRPVSDDLGFRPDGCSMSRSAGAPEFDKSVAPRGMRINCALDGARHQCLQYQ